MKITYEMLEELKTERGGYTHRVLKLIGANFPLKKGWRKKLLGQEIHAATLTKVLEFNENHNSRLKKKASKKPQPIVQNSEDDPWWTNPTPWAETAAGQEWFKRELKEGFAPWEEGCFELSS